MRYNRQSQKNVVDAYTLAETNVPTDGALPLEQNYISLGCAIVHTPGSTSITLRRPGLYLVNFNADGSTVTPRGEMSVELYKNGVSVPGAVATIKPSDQKIGSISFSKIIQVRPSCCAVDNTASLTFVNTGRDVLYNKINANVIKIEE